MSATDNSIECFDIPGLYYEEEALQIDTARAAGRLALIAARAGGQWQISAYDGRRVTSSQVDDDAPRLGSIMTDKEGMTDRPPYTEGNRVSPDQVWPIAAQWITDRGLESQFDRAETLRDGMYEHGDLGTVVPVQSKE